ncbi:MAG: hypothetical protein WEB89_09450 [Balneolales bacterium]
MYTRTSKVLLILLFLVVYFVPIRSSGQDGNANVSVSVSANVQSTIELITLSDISFGSVQPSQFELLVSANRDQNAGSMVATGRPNAEIRVNYTEEHILTRAGGNETLTFYYEVAGNDEDDQVAGEILDDLNRDMTFNSDGEFFLWIGGRVNIQDAVHGAYEGEFTIEIDYLQY